MSAPPTLASLRRRASDVQRIAQRHGAGNIRVFGSVVRGEATEGSDLDVLVDFTPTASLFDLVRLKRELEELLGSSVDVVEAAGLSPYLRERVLAEAVRL